MLQNILYIGIAFLIADSGLFLKSDIIADIMRTKGVDFHNFLATKITLGHERRIQCSVRCYGRI